MPNRPRQLYIDGIKVAPGGLISSKNIYSWYKMIDGKCKKVRTIDVDHSNTTGDVFLTSIDE